MAISPTLVSARPAVPDIIGSSSARATESVATIRCTGCSACHRNRASIQNPGLIPTDQIPGLLVDHAQIALASGRWVRFDEAGDDFNSRSVERVIVDLPARGQDAERGLVIRSVLARGDQVLSGSLWRATEAGQARWRGML